MVSTSTSGFCGVAVDKGVTTCVDAWVGMRVGAGVCAEVGTRVCFGAGFEIVAGTGVEVRVGVGGGSKSGATTLGAERASPVVTPTATVMVRTLPMVTPTTGASMVGILNHKDCRNPMVAAAVRIPSEMLMNFESPASLRAVIPSFLKRLSRFNARVFN